MVWEVRPHLHEQPVNTKATHTLTGHDDAVTSLATSPELDIVVSASDDGSVVVHTLHNGTYVRTLDTQQDLPQPAFAPAPIYTSGSLGTDQGGGGGPSGSHVPINAFISDAIAAATAGAAGVARIQWVGVSHQGYILTYSWDNRCMSSYSVNGVLLARIHVRERLHAFLFSEDGAVILTGGDRRQVVWRWVHDLTLARDGARMGFQASVDGSCEMHSVQAFGATIRCMALSQHERHLLVGLENGEVYILAPDSNYLRQRLQKQLRYLGFY